MRPLSTLVVLVLCIFTIVYCSSRENYRDQPAINLSLDPRPKVIQEEPVKELPFIDPKLAFFDTAQSTLRPDAKRALKPTADWLKKFEKVSLQIEGFCDERGSIEYNLELGQRRADAAKDYFVSQGIDAERISTLSYGRVMGAGAKERANNRRVGFVVIYPPAE